MNENRTINPYAGSIQVADGNNRDANGYKDFVHQNEAHKALSQAILNNNSNNSFSGLLVIPTGGGKTFTAVEWLLRYWTDKGKKVLWIAHRHELLDQAFGTFKKNCYANLLPNKRKIHYRLISGQHDKPVHIQSDDEILIASKDSLNHGMDYLIENWISANEMTELFFVIDEAHHATAKTYRKLINGIKKKVHNLKILGLTATPFRTSDKERGGLKKIFPDDIVHKTDLRTLVNRGILAEPVFKEETTQWKADENVSDKELEDINKFDLPEKVKSLIATNKERNNRIVDHYFENREQYKQLLVFALNIDHAITLNSLFNERGRSKNIKSDFVISNIQDATWRIDLTKENKDKLQKFREGTIQILVNVNIITEGTDLPNVQTVFLTRPTISKILMTQMIGRSLRGKKAGGTGNAYIVSFIDEWQNKIAWVNPEKLYLGDAIIVEPPDHKKRLIRLISIEKIEEFARIMDNTVDTNDLAALNFLDRIPVGIYAFSLLESVNGQESRERNCEVLVYCHLQKQYENFIVDLPNIFKAMKIDIDNAEELGMIDLNRLAMHSESKHFQNARGRLGFLENDIKDILKFYFDHEEAPLFIPLEGREKYDIDKIAQDIYDKDLGQKAKAEFLNELWDDEKTAWSALFGYNKHYFLNEVDLSLRKISHGYGILGKTDTKKPIDEKEQRKYEDMTLAQIYEADQEYWELLTTQVYRKYTNEKGEYFCAITGFTNKSRLAFEIDHVNPFSKGGKTLLENLQLVAWWKNIEKSDTVITAEKPKNTEGNKDTKDHDESVQDIADLTKQAHRGDLEAKFQLAEIYHYQQNDIIRAIKLYKEAAENGHASSQLSYAMLYHFGDDVQPDLKEAEKWYMESLKNGIEFAEYLLGTLYLENSDFLNHLDKAKKCFKNAAENGFPIAQNQIALMYQNGVGYKQNYKKAAEWHKKAADLGDADGQNYLGLLYGSGYGVEQNSEKALELFQLAADQGLSYAQSNLGYLYYYGGNGIRKDYEKAAFWYQKSAKQGNRDDQKRLARMYVKGKGVPQNDEQAYVWFNLAYEGVNEGAKEYQNVISRLSEAQLTESREKAEALRNQMEEG